MQPPMTKDITPIMDAVKEPPPLSVQEMSITKRVHPIQTDSISTLTNMIAEDSLELKETHGHQQSKYIFALLLLSPVHLIHNYSNYTSDSLLEREELWSPEIVLNITIILAVSRASFHMIHFQNTLIGQIRILCWFVKYFT